MNIEEFKNLIKRFNEIWQILKDLERSDNIEKIELIRNKLIDIAADITDSISG